MKRIGQHKQAYGWLPKLVGCGIIAGIILMSDSAPALSSPVAVMVGAAVVYLIAIRRGTRPRR